MMSLSNRILNGSFYSRVKEYSFLHASRTHAEKSSWIENVEPLSFEALKRILILSLYLANLTTIGHFLPVRKRPSLCVRSMSLSVRPSSSDQKVIFASDLGHNSLFPSSIPKKNRFDWRMQFSASSHFSPMILISDANFEKSSCVEDFI